MRTHQPAFLLRRPDFWHGYRDAIGVHVNRRWRDHTGQPLPPKEWLGDRPTDVFDWSRETPGTFRLARALLSDAINTRLLCNPDVITLFATNVVMRFQYPSFLIARGDIAAWLRSVRNRSLVLL